MASLDPAGSTESQTIVNLSELTAGHALGTARAPDASATSIPEPALQPQIPPNGLSPTSNYAYSNANTENSAYGGSAELGHLGAATSPTNTHFTLSRKEQLRRKKEDDDDEDWERRLYWVRDLADILGVEGLLKYDPNDGYKLRKQEKARREVEKEERRRAREGRTWLWLGGSAQPSTDLDMDETNGSINEKPDGQTTSPAVALPTAPSPVSRESTAAPSEDDDLDYQMIMDLVSNATKDMFPDGEVPPLPTDPTDPEYRENIHEFSQLAAKASRKSFYHWTCCGLFPVFWPQWRLVLRRTIRDPRFSIWANLWSLFMAFIIVVSLATLVMDSVQSLMVIPEWRGALVITGLVVLAVFALELALLWTTMKDLGEFFSWTNFVNIVTVFPPLIVIFIRLIYDNKLNREDAGFSVLTVMQHLLVLRVFKLTELSKRSNRMTLIFEAVKQSGDGILSLFVADFILMIFFSTIIFYAEGSGMFLDQQTGMWYYNEQYGGQISPFQNIPVTFWFVIVSITTTGYGDMIPKTIAGQICTSLMLIFAVALLAFPLAIINSNFGQLLKEQEKGREERQERRRMRRERVAGPLPVAESKGDALLKLVWNPLGPSTMITLSISRSALAIVLATRGVEAKLAEGGWTQGEDGTWCARSGSSEDVVDALRALVVGSQAG